VAEETESAEPAEATAKPAVRPMTKAGFTRFLMIFMFLLALLAMFDPVMSTQFGALLGLVLGPLIGFGGRYPVITILLAGMLTTTVSSVIRDHYTNWVKMTRMNKVMSAWRRANMEALRKGNQAKIQKMREIQQGFMRENMDVQFAPMKSMAWTFFFFIILFVWLRLFVDNTLSVLGNQFIAVPWAPQVYLQSAYVLPSWVLLYSLLAIPIGQIITRVLKYVRFRRKLEAMGVPLKAEVAP